MTYVGMTPIDPEDFKTGRILSIKLNLRRELEKQGKLLLNCYNILPFNMARQFFSQYIGMGYEPAQEIIKTTQFFYTVYTFKHL